MSIEIPIIIAIGVVSMTLSNCRSTILIVIITVIAMLVNNGTLDMSFQRYGISANRATAAKKSDTLKHTPNPQNSENTLKHTPNPNMDEKEKEQNGENLKQTVNAKADKNENDLKQTPNTRTSNTTDADTKSNSEELKQTPNPRAQNNNSAPVSNPLTSTHIGGSQYVFSKTNMEDYTIEGMQKKVQERLFSKKDITQHSSDERARLLNSLYSDLISENYKKDPYMRENDSTGCDLVRGNVNPIVHNDC